MEKLSSSVVIPTRNRPHEIIKLFDSLKQQSVQPDEIIVVDSSDLKLIDDPEFQKKFNSSFFGNSQLVYKYSEQRGAALQRNIGITLSNYELIHFIDDDMFLDQNYLQELNSTFIKNPEFVGGMGNIENIETVKKFSLHRIFRKLFLLQRNFAYGDFTYSGMPTHLYGNNIEFNKVKVLCGTVTYRRAVVSKFLFDEKLGAYSYMEDCDLSKRVSDQYELFFNSKAKSNHLVSKNNRMDVVQNRRIFIRNYSYLFFKNFYSQNRLKVFAYMWSVIGLFLEALILKKPDHLKGYLLGLKDYYYHKKMY